VGDSVASLAYGVPSLVHLDLSFLTKMTDRAVIALSSLPRLQQINLEVTST